ncbi:MAG: adenylate kinase [Gemmatimonadota bacterium]|nr:adenylate kinase [Gemmatimonadota bacterium]MDE3013635.1 adenylate kinase [Gemmatimonadota bacterium]
MVVVLLGPPGVGKGTQAVRLVDELSAAHVSTGDLLRAARRDGTELGKIAQGFMDRGELVPDELILDLVKEHLAGIDASTDVMFDGFPRTTDQATGLDGVLEASGRKVDSVVLFEAPDDVLIKRLSGRRSCPDCGAVFNTYFSPPAAEGVCDRCGGALVHRADDEPETVQRRLQVYLDQTAPLIAFYEEHPAMMTSIAADRDVDQIYGEFRSAVTAGDGADS